MKVGVNLINFGPSAVPEVLLGWARLTEALGYHFLMVSDHLATTADVAERYPAPFYEPLSTLGWLAGITRRIELGTTVLIVPYRSPLETARAFANLDQLSGGRLILGVGVGWAEQEFTALGVPFRRRGAIADEYLGAIERLWRDDRASFEGEFVSFRDVDTRPRPRRSPRIPIWVGGGSEAALRRAVRFGDAWHPFRVRLPWLRERAGALARLAADAGRPVPALCPRIRLHITDGPMAAPRLAGEGTLEQIRGDLRALEELGCSHVLLDTFHDDVEATRRPETAWRMLTVLAEETLDLPAEKVRQ